MNLTQRHLKMFTWTAALGNVSRASEALHISQPALTRALQEFENQIGTPLFHRTTRRLMLTDAGVRFLPVAQRLLREMEDAIAELNPASEGPRGTVVLATGAAFGCTVLPGALKDLRARHPGIRVRLVEDHSTGICERVARAEADVGIGSPLGDTSGLHCEPLLSAPIGLLADAKRFDLGTGNLKALRSLPLLKESADTSIAQILRSHGSDLVAWMEGGIEVSSLALQLALARAGVGVAVVSALAASHPYAAGLRFVALRPALRRELFLLRRRDRAPTAATEALAAALRTALERTQLQESVRLTR